jgi:saccharopepsin
MLLLLSEPLLRSSRSFSTLDLPTFGFLPPSVPRSLVSYVP